MSSAIESSFDDEFESADSFSSALDASEDRNSTPPLSVFERLWELTRAFWWFGFVSFGGPHVNIVLLHDNVVGRLGWFDEKLFAELFAICQGLPGPPSVHMMWATGVVRSKMQLGGALLFLLYVLPGACVMAGLGVASVTVLQRLDAWWWVGLQRGFRNAGVALIAAVAIKLGARLAPADDSLRRSIVVATVCITVMVREAWIFPVAIATGGLLTLVRDSVRPQLFRTRTVVEERDEPAASFGVATSMLTCGVAIVAWIAILVALISARGTDPQNDLLAQSEIFWRIASLVFGGGQVVIPQLMNELQQWIPVETFLLGFAWVQAMPGPLFNLSAFVGAAMSGGDVGVAALCCISLFGPGILIISGVLPVWSRIRRSLVVRRLLDGVNAAAVGLVVTAIYQLAVVAIRDSTDAAMGILLLSLNVWFSVKAPFVVLAGGLLGIVASAILTFPLDTQYHIAICPPCNVTH
jgi:chromate transporter